MDTKKNESLNRKKESVLKELFGSMKFENTDEIFRETRKDLKGR